MQETWHYDKVKRIGKNGQRWHFVIRQFHDADIEHNERPYELYFRTDEKTEYGLLRFERQKDNPYRDYEAVISKIMNNPPFRRALINPETAGVWKKNWK